MRVGDVLVGGEHIAVIAGPCAVESLDQALTIAREVKRPVRRSSAAAPSTRATRPVVSRLEEQGLKILAEVRDPGFGVVTEITSPSRPTS